MEKLSYLRGLLLALVLVGQPVLAQEPSSRIGVGASLSEFNLVSAFGNQGQLIPSVLIPIDLASSFRIEPVVGFIRVRMEENSDFSDSEETITLVRLGSGIFWTSRRPERKVYLGARLGYDSIRVEGDDDDETTDGFFGALVLGGSYYFSDHVGLGAEVGLKLSKLTGDDDGFESTYSFVGLEPAVVLRFFP